MITVYISVNNQRYLRLAQRVRPFWESLGYYVHLVGTEDGNLKHACDSFIPRPPWTDLIAWARYVRYRMAAISDGDAMISDADLFPLSGLEYRYLQCVTKGDWDLIVSFSNAFPNGVDRGYYPACHTIWRPGVLRRIMVDTEQAAADDRNARLSLTSKDYCDERWIAHCLRRQRLNSVLLNSVLLKRPLYCTGQPADRLDRGDWPQDICQALSTDQRFVDAHVPVDISDDDIDVLYDTLRGWRGSMMDCPERGSGDV